MNKIIIAGSLFSILLVSSSYAQDKDITENFDQLQATMYNRADMLPPDSIYTVSAIKQLYTQNTQIIKLL